MTASPQVTELLDATARGESGAEARLLERVYAELHGMASGLLAREAPGCSVQATMLVHDAWLNLVGESRGESNGESTAESFERRGHFFGAAARAMRRLLVDHARRRAASKRGGDALRVTFSDVPDAAQRAAFEVLALHDALEELAETAPGAAAVVEVRYFAGLSISEAAVALDRSTATVKREWAYARAWLHDRLRDEQD